MFTTVLGFQIGLEYGDCWAFFPDCDYSLFDFLPGLKPDGSKVEIVVDKIETGTKVSDLDLSEDRFNDVFTDMRTVNSKFDIKSVINK